MPSPSNTDATRYDNDSNNEEESRMTGRSAARPPIPTSSSASAAFPKGSNPQSSLPLPPHKDSYSPNNRSALSSREPHYPHYSHNYVALPPISLVSTCEEMNPSRRSSFEDCSIYAPSGTWNCPDENMAMLAVADGHGGRDIVEFLEDALLYHVSEELQLDYQEGSNVDPSSPSTNNDGCRRNTTSQNDTIPARLERAFLITDIHSKTMGLMSSGATVAMCLVTRGNNGIYYTNRDVQQSNDNMQNTWTIYAANAGDARIVLGHGGKAHRITKDHRTDDPDEVRRIEECGGFIFKGRVLGILAVTRSLGDHCMKEYVIAKPYTSETSIDIRPETDISFIILACDGLWDVIKDQEAVDFVVDRITEKELVAKYLVEEALKRGSTDNITVSVAFLT